MPQRPMCQDKATTSPRGEPRSLHRRNSKGPTPQRSTFNSLHQRPWRNGPRKTSSKHLARLVATLCLLGAALGGVNATLEDQRGIGIGSRDGHATLSGHACNLPVLGAAAKACAPSHESSLVLEGDGGGEEGGRCRPRDHRRGLGDGLSRAAAMAMGSGSGLLHGGGLPWETVEAVVSSKERPRHSTAPTHVGAAAGCAAVVAEEGGVIDPVPITTITVTSITRRGGNNRNQRSLRSNGKWGSWR